jgi:uncharacterized protein (DUF697 family)
MQLGVAQQLAKALRHALGAAEVGAGELEHALAEAAARQPAPVLWLLGTTQSGKTSIVRALTGSSRAEIGSGYQPCTRTASLYEFPADAPVLTFLDTRGLGEVSYDPADDIAWCEARAHIVIAVLRAGETRPQALAEALNAVRRRHPDWPVIVAQTCLHHAYPAEFEHPLPYPFTEPGWEAQVPDGLRRQLLAQRQAFAELPGTGAVLWVPIDFTQPEDGWTPLDYGVDALWQAIEQACALDLRARVRGEAAVQDLYTRVTHPRIVGFSLAAATVGALPLVDLALVPALQAGMLRGLAATYHLHWSGRHTAEFLGLLGGGIAAGYGLKLVGRSVIKLVPGFGQTAGALWGASASGAVTYALGKAACAYLSRRNESLPADATHIRTVYAEALTRGRALVIGSRRGQSSGAPAG